MDKNSPNDLTLIPGVGPKIVQYLREVGIEKIPDLKHKKPEDIYHACCLHRGHPIDRCLLYVTRVTVYFAEHKIHNPEKLKWWRWKD